MNLAVCISLWDGILIIILLLLMVLTIKIGYDIIWIVRGEKKTKKNKKGDGRK
jgi:hypothetical protein